jgi:hypothetical protein
VSGFLLVQGDLLPELAGALVPAAGQSFDLNGATVWLRLRTPGTNALLFEKQCVVLDPVALSVKYVWAAGDTAVPGAYGGRFLVRFPGGITESFPNNRDFLVTIKPG